jgi:hypothetical protein
LTKVEDFPKQDVTDETVTVQAGQLVSLSRLFEPESLLFEESWSIEGERLSAYVTTPQEGKRVPSTPQALSFYWYKAGTYKVTYTATLSAFGNITVTKEATFVAEKPSATLSVATEEISVITFKDGIDFTGLVFGNPVTSANGIRIPIPPATHGKFGWFSFVVNSATVGVVNIEGVFKTIESNTTSAYDGSSLPYSEGVDFVDSPQRPFPAAPLVSIITVNSYKTFLMFKPNGQFSIWIPIASVGWNWAATLDKNDSGQFEIHAPSHTTPATAEISDENEPPEWDHNRP